MVPHAGIGVPGWDWYPRLGLVSHCWDWCPMLGLVSPTAGTGVPRAETGASITKEETVVGS